MHINPHTPFISHPLLPLSLCFLDLASPNKYHLFGSKVSPLQVCLMLPFPLGVNILSCSIQDHPVSPQLSSTFP